MRLRSRRGAKASQDRFASFEGEAQKPYLPVEPAPFRAPSSGSTGSATATLKDSPYRNGQGDDIAKSAKSMALMPLPNAELLATDGISHGT
jgi:hypothetical protein